MYPLWTPFVPFRTHRLTAHLVPPTRGTRMQQYSIVSYRSIIPYYTILYHTKRYARRLCFFSLKLSQHTSFPRIMAEALFVTRTFCFYPLTPPFLSRYLLRTFCFYPLTPLFSLDISFSLFRLVFLRSYTIQNPQALLIEIK
jgi:hypothetical protein